MFCRYCGSKLKDGVKFCTNCGQRTTIAQTIIAEQRGLTVGNSPTANNKHNLLLTLIVIALSVASIAGFFVNTMSAYYIKLYTKSELKNSKSDYMSVQDLFDLADIDVDTTVKTEYGYSLKELKKDKNEHVFSFSELIKQYYRNYSNNTRIIKKLDKDEYTKIFNNVTVNDNEAKTASMIILLIRLIILLLYISSSSIIIIISLIKLSKKKQRSFFNLIKCSSTITFAGYLIFFALTIVELIADLRQEYHFSNISYNWIYFLFMIISFANIIISSIGTRQEPRTSSQI